MNPSEFTPSYTWPNPAFPFRVYLDHPKLRIFIIENIQHNWKWLKDYSKNFRETDFFLVYCGWYHSIEFATEADKIFRILNLDQDRFYFLFNSRLEQLNFAKFGFKGKIINQNAWLDEKSVMRPMNIEKKYDAIYVGRRSAFKRHLLAEKIENLALVAGNNHGNNLSPIPSHSYINDNPLSPDDVCRKINESRCGLILSLVEGACFASSEYLLCGIPVVSTHSFGGRDVWYNEYNSIICDATSDSIFAAVEEFKSNPRDPQLIRQMHIDLAKHFRNEFISLLHNIFSLYGVIDLDPKKYFEDNFFHKLRRSYSPKMNELFPTHNQTA